MKLRVPPQLFVVCMTAVLLALAAYVVYVISDPTRTLMGQSLYIAAALTLGLIAFNIFQLFSTRDTARLMAEMMTENIAEETALFEELYRNSPVAYARLQKNGDIISANASMVRFFEVETGRLDGLSIFALVAASNETKASLLPSEITRGQYINDTEVMATTSNGAQRWALLSSFPYGHNNERLITLFDITKQKEVDIAKSEFVSLASHQLRTPISAIKWNLELLGSDSLGPLTDGQREYIAKVTRNTEKMQLIINDFLDVSQLEMGTFATEVSTVLVDTFLESVYEEFTERIAAKQLTLQADYEVSGLSIQTDARLLHNSISNLISNAVKYTPEGGTITVTRVANEHAVVFTISDTGIGIPPEEQDRLFTKFFRATNAKTDITEGTGLGLYIVAQAVDKLSGTIAVSSQPGSGTTFTVTIPRSLS